MDKPYPHTRKRHDMVLASLIGERVDIRVEAVDDKTTLVSLSVGNSHLSEGKLGVAVALKNEELLHLRNALNDMLTGELA
jgi:hypothetical protein